MNYIKHLNKVILMFHGDARMTANHISIYLALFKNANDHRFENPFSIYRQEVMDGSKVYSIATYTRCLQQLHEWGYIRYITSHNPKHGSQIYLVDFGNTPEKTLGNTAENTVGNTLPYIENTKKTKDLKEIPPTLDEVISFFSEQKFPEIEAKKFYNHYQSNGWQVGGRAPMKDWQAAAQNWMLNADKFNKNESEPKPAYLQLSNATDYSEPL